MRTLQYIDLGIKYPTYRVLKYFKALRQKLLFLFIFNGLQCLKSLTCLEFNLRQVLRQHNILFYKALRNFGLMS